MNNRERELWIDNDEGLYNWKRSSGLSMRNFIKENREEIDKAIDPDGTLGRQENNRRKGIF